MQNIVNHCESIGVPIRTLPKLHEMVSSSAALDEACHDLWTWLQGGGFAPRWGDEPLATSYYDTRAYVERARS